MKQQQRDKEEVLQRREQQRLAKQSLQAARRVPEASREDVRSRGEEQRREHEEAVHDGIEGFSTRSLRSQQEKNASCSDSASGALEVGRAVSDARARTEGTHSAISFEWCV